MLLIQNNDNGSCESSSGECDDDDSMQVQSYQDSASIPDDDGTFISSAASRFSRESVTGASPCVNVDTAKIEEELAESPVRRKTSRSTAFRGVMREPSRARESGGGGPARHTSRQRRSLRRMTCHPC